MELYTIPIPGEDGGGRVVIYRPLVGLAFVGNRAMARLARQLADGATPAPPGPALRYLDTIGFLRPDPPAPALPAGFHPTTAVLLMTNRCQLRCTYCYASAGDGPAEMLTPDQGKAAIDYVAGAAAAQGDALYHVAFHGGGEPTLAWPVLEACVAHARQKPLPARIGMTSNAVWTARQAGWIVAHLDELTVSFDGAPETQDYQRPLASGRPSSGAVLRSLETLDRAGFTYGIRMTATAPWDRFAGDVRFICEHTGCRSIQVEPAFNTGRGGHCEGPESEYAAFAAAFTAALEEAGRAGRHLFYSGARPGFVTSSFCRAPFDALIVAPGGSLVACYEVTSATHPLAALSAIGGYGADGVRLDEAARDRLHGLMAERRAGCRDCFCYYSCAGDCYTRGFADGPGGHLVHGPRCGLNRQLTLTLLLQAIAAGDGVWRREPAGSPPGGSSGEARRVEYVQP